MGQILYPLEYAVAWIMVGWHSLLSGIGMDPDSGWTWAFSIVGLVIVIRIILIPLFVKQIKASRGMQLIQPQMQAIQKKYKGKTDPESRQAMTSETMALYKESGTNPFASCLPIILQAPIFFALFRVLNQYVSNSKPIGPLTKELATSADNSTIFGAPLSASFLNANGNMSVKIVTVILIIAMSATTFTTQRQLMMKNMPAAALDNPFAKQQKMLMYVLPLVFAISGVNFPIGVLIYWLTTNLWSMGQQFYVIRRMPAPGSLAEQAMLERKRKHGKGGVELEEVEEEAPAPQAGQRVQPKRQPKAKRQPKGSAAAGTDGTGPQPADDDSAAGSVADAGADVPDPASPNGVAPTSDRPAVNGTPKTPARKKPKSGR